MNKVSRAFLLLLLSLLISTSLSAQSKNIRWYAVFDNYVDPSLGDGDQDRRCIEVFVNDGWFSKAHLIRMYRQIAKEYPNPILLFVTVSTDKAEVGTPKTRAEPKIHISYSPVAEPTKSKLPRGEKSLPTRFVGQWASFVRRSDGSVLLRIRSGNDHDEAEFR